MTTLRNDAPSDLDIYRTANVLIRQHGADAPIEAARRADDMLDHGDMEGAATAALKSMIDHAGWVVTLTETDAHGDRYGRLLAGVWADGIDVGGWLVDHGYARIWPDGAE